MHTSLGESTLVSVTQTCSNIVFHKPTRACQLANRVEIPSNCHPGIGKIVELIEEHLSCGHVGNICCLHGRSSSALRSIRLSCRSLDDSCWVFQLYSRVGRHASACGRRYSSTSA